MGRDERAWGAEGSGFALSPDADFEVACSASPVVHIEVPEENIAVAEKLCEFRFDLELFGRLDVRWGFPVLKLFGPEFFQELLPGIVH